MPKFDANLTLLYTELPFMDRFAAAAGDGFSGVEYLFPYAYEKDKLVEALKTNRLAQVLHNLPAGDWAAGDRGIACDPGRIAEFQDGVGLALEYASALGCKMLNCLVGKTPASTSPERVRETLVRNLKFAAKYLKKSGVRLLVEAVNSVDVAGFYLDNSTKAIEVISEVSEDNLYLQYDIYHMQMMEGNLAATMEKYLDKIAHIQLADVPGRHEPGTGEINFSFLFHHLDRLGYAGWVGCEYVPLVSGKNSLKWLKDAECGRNELLGGKA